MVTLLNMRLPSFVLRHPAPERVELTSSTGAIVSPEGMPRRTLTIYKSTVRCFYIFIEVFVPYLLPDPLREKAGQAMYSPNYLLD